GAFRFSVSKSPMDLLNNSFAWLAGNPFFLAQAFSNSGTEGVQHCRNSETGKRLDQSLQSADWIGDRAAHIAGNQSPSRHGAGAGFEYPLIMRFDFTKEHSSAFDLLQKFGGWFSQRQLNHLGECGVFCFVPCRRTD